MFNFTLYKREMKNSWKMLLIFAAILTLYLTMIIDMYSPEMSETLNRLAEMMPEMMAAFGMSIVPPTLMGHLISYLYGMLLLIFPMLFTILRVNGLIARYVDRGSMTSLIAAPIKRRAVAFTQMKVLATGIFVLVFFITALQIIVSEVSFPGELEMGKIFALNGGLLCLQFFIGGICFFASCLFSDAKYSVGFGAGIPTLMYILQMLANTGGDAENIKYLTFFTLYHPEGIIAGQTSAIAGIVVLFTGAVVLFAAAIAVFSRKDLHL